MAQITLTIPPTAATRFIKAINYQVTLPDGTPNPVTAVETAKAWMINTIKQFIKQSEGSTVSKTAMDANDADIDTNILIS